MTEVKRRPAWAFAVLLQGHLDRPVSTRGRVQRPISQGELAAGTGASYRSVNGWLNGHRAPDAKNLAAIEHFLFEGRSEDYADEIEELRAIAANCRLRQKLKTIQPSADAAPLSKRFYTDPLAELANLGYPDIDLLPVDDGWRFSEIHYGEGVQCVCVPGASLYWLDPPVRLVDPSGDRAALTEYFPDTLDEIEALAARTEIFLPRRIEIRGPKRHDAAVRMFACTDIPYPQDLDENPGDQFAVEALIGMGGLAAFLDRHGKFRERSASEIGGGSGCVAVLVAVAYVGRRARYRTPYCLVIRKGIRYPDDVWLSPATGQPVFSGPKPLSSRFLFQSRESKGCSTDMFVADFNGTGLVNLCEGDESASDGFVDDDGHDLVSWAGNRITFGSKINGNGILQAITREDPYDLIEFPPRWI